MNKELEALEVLLKDLKHRLLVRKDGDENIQRDYIEIVETALNRLPELEKENVLLRENIHSLEELMKRPELELVRENIQLKRDNDLLLMNECSARQENKKLEEVLKIIKEKVINERLIVVDWEDEFPDYTEVKGYTGYAIYDYKGTTFVRISETEFDLLKEYLK